MSRRGGAIIQAFLVTDSIEELSNFWDTHDRNRL